MKKSREVYKNRASNLVRLSLIFDDQIESIIRFDRQFIADTRDLNARNRFPILEVCCYNREVKMCNTDQKLIILEEISEEIDKLKKDLLIEKLAGLE